MAIPNLIKICSAFFELNHANRQMDGRTDMVSSISAHTVQTANSNLKICHKKNVNLIAYIACLCCHVSFHANTSHAIHVTSVSILCILKHFTTSNTPSRFLWSSSTFCVFASVSASHFLILSSFCFSLFLFLPFQVPAVLDKT
jgi:hypothetical protein